jgi:prepilin-type N-terminal cleavage/methylation domain-containing protein
MMSLTNRNKTIGDQANESQRGFTLVELAIVLVIIGLIIAAVLKGQELIVSARLKSTISDIDAIRSATNTFRDKYSALPGDYVSAQARIGTPAGVTWTDCDGSTDCDGNGVIDGDGTDSETLLFWNQLSAASMISGVSPMGTAIIGDGLPASPIGGGLTVRNELVVNKTTHWITLGSAAATPTGVLDSEQALIIDEKADDARPGTGSIRTVTGTCTDVVSPAEVSATSAYDADPPAAGCVVKFEL